MSRSAPLFHRSWQEALRAFAASDGAAPRSDLPTPDTAARLAACELVARAHLFGPPGHRLTSDALRVMREARWVLLRTGTPRTKSVVLERLLALYAEAAASLLYDTVPTRAERQSLLLEQVQSILEARVTGVPLSAQHYRHPLRSPQLAEVDVELPLILLRELEATEAGSGPHECHTRSMASRRTPPVSLNAPERPCPLTDVAAARLDCAVGLAAAGHPMAALPLCTAAGFPYVMAEVVRLRRDGWRAAWALADTVPLPRLLSPEKEEVGWREGLLTAARARFHATADAAVWEWLTGFVDVWRRTHLPEQGGPRVPVRVMETLLAVAPACQWRDVLRVVLAYNAEVAAEAGTSAETLDGSDGGDRCVGGERVAMGRLMALLHVAGQPFEVLKLFYGSEARAREVLDQSCSPAATAMVASVGNDWASPSGELLSGSDRHHPATYNHTMMAFARLGYGSLAMAFREAVPASCVNRLTHWTAARMFLQDDLHHVRRHPAPPGSSSDAIPAAREDSAALSDPATAARVYACCVSSVHRALGRVGDTTGLPGVEAVMESLALWAASRQDTRTVVALADAAPASCRYVRLIAIAVLLRAVDAEAGGFACEEAKGGAQPHPVPRALLAELPGLGGSGEGGQPLPERSPSATPVDGASAGVELARQLSALLSAPSVSLKQACLATAFLANAAAAPVVLGADGVETTAADCAADKPTVSLLAPEVVQGVVCVLGRHIHRSQAAADHCVTTLVEQFVSLRARQLRRRAVGPPSWTGGDADGGHCPSFARAQVLSEVMRLCEEVVPNPEEGWRVVHQVLKELGDRERVTVARAAPALVSAGVRAEVAMKFLDA